MNDKVVIRFLWKKPDVCSLLVLSSGPRVWFLCSHTVTEAKRLTGLRQHGMVKWNVTTCPCPSPTGDWVSFWASISSAVNVGNGSPNCIWTARWGKHMKHNNNHPKFGGRVEGIGGEVSNREEGKVWHLVASVTAAPHGAADHLGGSQAGFVFIKA